MLVDCGDNRATTALTSPVARMPPELEEDLMSTKSQYCLHVMGDKQDCSTLPSRYFVHFSKTFLLEFNISDREHLIDDENFWLQMRGHGKRQDGRTCRCCSMFTGVSRNFSTSAKATISSNFLKISRCVIPSIAPLRKIFSLPVSSGWKPVPTSSRLATRPRSTTRPAVGSVIRLNIFSSVLFPAPLRPMIPTASPCLISKFTSLSAQNSSTSSPCTI